LDVYLFNTGRIGGPASDGGSKKVGIHHSAAVQAGIVDGTIEWETDPDFGYDVATSIPGFDDAHLLRPRTMYEEQGRADEYREIVETLMEERRDYFAEYPALDDRVAVGR
jgi:phosphoenolpyruvate carboxykinase (ATP)